MHDGESINATEEEKEAELQLLRHKHEVCKEVLSRLIMELL